MDRKTTLAHWSKNRKIVIIALIFVYPMGVYLMWKGKHFNPDLRWMITVFWLICSMVLGKYGTSESDIPECSATLYVNGCTYYRDNTCQVITQSCD